MRIGATIRKLRIERNLTQGDVESRAGMTVGNLSRIERDEQNYNGEILSSLATALQVPIQRFFDTSPAPGTPDEILEQSVAQRLVTARNAAGKTQEQIAEICNITKAAISSIENGETGISSSNLFPIADALNVNARWLLTGIKGDDSVGSNDVKLSPLGKKIAIHISVLPEEKIDAWAKILGIKLT